MIEPDARSQIPFQRASGRSSTTSDARTSPDRPVSVLFRTVAPRRGQPSSRLIAATAPSNQSFHQASSPAHGRFKIVLRSALGAYSRLDVTFCCDLVSAWHLIMK
jgi:hypothetical protein